MTDFLRKVSLGRTVCTGLPTGGHRDRAAIYKPKVGDPQHKPILLTPWALDFRCSKLCENNFLLLR